MTKKLFGKAVFNGLINGTILFLLLNFVISVFSNSLSVVQLSFISGFFAIFAAGVYFFFVVKESSNKSIAIFNLCSFVFSAASTVAYLALPFRPLPLRETSTGDGISLLYMASIFIFLLLVLEFLIAIAVVIKNLRRSTGNGSSTGDGTVCSENNP